MSKVKTAGQSVVERIEGWISGYMVLGDGLALVAALWAVHTWVFHMFDATPYLCVNAATKGAGKTRLLELLSMIAQNGRRFGDMTPASLFRGLKLWNGKMSIFFDESEKLSSAAAGVMRSVMNTGYRRGQVVTRATPNGGVEDFPVFCPKSFALIGDVNSTLRDRSIVLTLERGVPAREFDWATAEGEAAAIVEAIKAMFAGVPGVGAVAPSFLSGRDKEIWSTLFGLASALGLDKAMMDRLTVVAADLAALKTAPAKRYTEADRAADEAAAQDATYGERALRDLASVIGEGEPGIFSAVAVERLKAIPTSGWRTFRGLGLNEVMLAGLVSRFGVQTKNVRMIKGKGAKAAKMLKGYSAADVRASVKA